MKTKNLAKHLNEVEEIIDYEFDNKALLLQAFTRSSYSAEYGGENNEVLEFLGDRVLDYYVVKSIADRFGFMKSESAYYDEENDLNEYCIIAHKNEADFTVLKKEIVNNSNLAKHIDRLKLAQYMYLGTSDIDNNVTIQPKVKADLFEAIIGAVAIDSNWHSDVLQNVIETMLQIDDYFEDVDYEEERPEEFKEENAISTLKEYAEHGICSIPKYYQETEAKLGDDGRQWWECTCRVDSWNITKTASATSKKEAKRYAAYLVLCKRYNLPNEFENN